MADYRVYFVGSDGHIRHAADIECADDEAAIQQAADMSNGCRVDLWCGTRRVTIINDKQAKSK